MSLILRILAVGIFTISFTSAHNPENATTREADQEDARLFMSKGADNFDTTVADLEPQSRQRLATLTIPFSKCSKGYISLIFGKAHICVPRTSLKFTPKNEAGPNMEHVHSTRTRDIPNINNCMPGYMLMYWGSYITCILKHKKSVPTFGASPYVEQHVRQKRGVKGGIYVSPDGCKAGFKPVLYKIGEGKSTKTYYKCEPSLKFKPKNEAVPHMEHVHSTRKRDIPNINNCMPGYMLMYWGSNITCILKHNNSVPTFGASPYVEQHVGQKRGIEGGIYVSPDGCKAGFKPVLYKIGEGNSTKTYYKCEPTEHGSGRRPKYSLWLGILVSTVILYT